MECSSASALPARLLHDPQVLILDEPASGLDPHARIEMRALLLRLAEADKTLIVTSHILPELSRVCSVIAIITDGRLRAYGSLDQIMARINQRRTFEIQLLDAEMIESVRQSVVESLVAGPEDGVIGSATECVVRFKTDRADDQLAQLLAHLVDRGIRVAQFREVPTDLEDAFLTVTRSDHGEDIDSETVMPAEKTIAPVGESETP